MIGRADLEMNYESGDRRVGLTRVPMIILREFQAQ
jgi:hypothetical protein